MNKLRVGAGIIWPASRIY